MIRQATVSVRRAPACLIVLLLAACAGEPVVRPEATVDPDVARARVAARLPPQLDSRMGWAVDIFAAFEALEIIPSRENICAVAAVAAQETGFNVDPVIPGLAGIARRELEAKAASHKVPRLLLNAALALRSPDGRSYGERLDRARTEKELSELFEDFIGAVPLGKRLFADLNPVSTAGPMQVSIGFAGQHARGKRYPYRYTGNLRNEVFTRRGGLYFGIAHLFDYAVDYEQMIHRFADFNAGQYASRNAAFQSAVSRISGAPLRLDGDLLLRGSDSGEPGKTEQATRKLGDRLRLSNEQIHADLARGKEESFTGSRLYARVFELADRQAGRLLPRAVVPTIRLVSPKITRSLTTGWFARRVDDRYKRCLARTP